MAQSGNRIQATKKLLQKAVEEAKLDKEEKKHEAEEDEKASWLEAQSPKPNPLYHN